MERALIFLFDYNQTFSRQILMKALSINCHYYTFSGRTVVPCEQTDGHDEATVAFRSFANAPKKLTEIIDTV